MRRYYDVGVGEKKGNRLALENIERPHLKERGKKSGLLSTKVVDQETL